MTLHFVFNSNKTLTESHEIVKVGYCLNECLSGQKVYAT